MPDKSTIYQILTEFTVVIHLLFILFVVVGGFFVRGRRWLMVLHLGAVAWGLFVELSPGTICPLTNLENYFANHAGLATYREDFVTRYLIPIIYPEGLTNSVQYVLAGIVILMNVIAYSKAWKRNRK